ncbi:LuxR C-terminal-related transcriptional regulator [Donghicola sp.]|jgi:DNA-binding CsgD family transcriptional regulator|uniref:helix-turn-helix transcriptional regulator n=1 Tax=Donghicola sp. TaxID=1929294 RepID=UPI0025DEF603|nr:LuxR C-terminal-related transcriptional regulator [Donghicola sp.]MCT4575846.1 LuxR C-terminal-related transcriptional regulator [Donghicola sp.]
MKEAEKKMRLQRLGMASVIGLQAFCALVFIWEIVVSVLGLPFNLVPWGLFELVEIGAAIGLLLGIIVGGMVLRNTARRAEAAETRLRAASREFMELLEERFLEWGLTPAERDVALFAFKGLSTAEIAGMRNTSEGTVKAQTAAIYRKASVSGRAQLMSVIIEDLLMDESQPSPFRQAAE